MKYFILFSLLYGCANFSASHPTILPNGTARINKSIQTWKDILEKNVIMQQTDYSCGAGAMATLMRYYFEDHITEKTVLQDISSHLNADEMKIRKKDGFSMFDLQQFAKRRGYQAIGVKLKASTLTKLRGPVLVYVETKGYKHFSILRGVKNNLVFLADPSRGNLRMSIEDFTKEWAGITLVLGKKGFGTPTEHKLSIQEHELIRNEFRIVRNGLYH